MIIFDDMIIATTIAFTTTTNIIIELNWIDHTIIF